MTPRPTEAPFSDVRRAPGSRPARAFVQSVLVLSIAVVFTGCSERASAPKSAPAQSVASAAPAPSSAQPPTGAPSATPAVARPAREEGPAWSSLNAAQRSALKPLETIWASLHGQQKAKWVVIARDFAQKSPQEQALLHSRMVEWARLTPAQREQARLNYGVAQEIAGKSSKTKREEWEAYQALTDAEKHKLAAQAPRHVPNLPTPVRPTPTDKLAVLPAPTPAPEGSEPATARQPKIITSPEQIDPATLLPLTPGP